MALRLCSSILLGSIIVTVSDGFVFVARPSGLSRTAMEAKTLRLHYEAFVLGISENKQGEWDVQRYQEQHSFVWKYGTPLVDLLESQAGERILDVGCGTGELTFEISNHAAANGNNLIEAVGMDSDLNMVQQAQAQFPRQHFFQGDVRSFTVDEPFDAIFSNAALHWVAAEDSERSVISMAKALKKGGRFVVEFGGKGNVQKIVEATLEVIPEASCPWYFPSISEYTTILERHGIEVLQASLFDRPTPLEDGKEGVKNWLRMFGAAFFEGKANDEIEMALDQIDQKLRDGNSSILTEDGSRWIADYRRIRIVGRKTT